eukprot:1149868-Pelagomonas_calceolata.AAC.2
MQPMSQPSNAAQHSKLLTTQARIHSQNVPRSLPDNFSMLSHHGIQSHAVVPYSTEVPNPCTLGLLTGPIF